jgi:siderophore synthetase component
MIIFLLQEFRKYNPGLDHSTPSRLMLAHRDIVDTEPSSGDVYKMLLGSFIPEYDYADKDANSWSLST